MENEISKLRRFGGQEMDLKVIPRKSQKVSWHENNPRNGGIPETSRAGGGKSYRIKCSCLIWCYLGLNDNLKQQHQALRRLAQRGQLGLGRLRRAPAIQQERRSTQPIKATKGAAPIQGRNERTTKYKMRGEGGGFGQENNAR